MKAHAMQAFFDFDALLAPAPAEKATNKPKAKGFPTVHTTIKKEGKGRVVVVNSLEDASVVDETTIEQFERQIAGQTVYIVRVRRVYGEGGEYVEPDHVWPTPIEARLDVRDWTELAKKTDW